MRFVTIGAYGFTPTTFIRVLTRERVDTFADLRHRRGVRGHDYAFLNHRRLEALLGKAGIRYVYLDQLAPSADILAIQFAVDRQRGESPRTRHDLAPAYIKAYKRQVLDRYDIRELADQVGAEANVIALFCVETDPAACHRSLVARLLTNKRVVNLKPVKS